MCKTKSKFSKHKNSDNSKATGSSDLKLSQKLLTIGATILQNFSPLPPAVQKLLPKSYIYTPFKTITLKYTVLFAQLASFKTITLDYTAIPYKFPFKIPIGAIVIVISVQNAKFDHFKTLNLVYF